MKLDSQVSRADLLRALQTCNHDKARFAETADLFGYQASPEYWVQALSAEQVGEPKPEPLSVGSEDTEPTENPVLRPPKPRPQVSYYYLVHRERYASEESAAKEQPELFEGIEPLRDEELHGFWDEQVPLHPEKLTRSVSMTPVIRKGLLQEVGRRLDIKTLVKQIARQAPLRRFPTEPRLLPAGRVTVIADLNQRLLPFWEDIREACELIRQKHGRIGLDMRVLAKDEPLADYYDFDDWLKRQLKAKAWEKIPAQSVVFILSDLGQLAAKDSWIRKRWQYFVTQLNRRGIKPWVLAPIAAEKQCPLLQTGTQLLLWQRFGQLKQQRNRGDKARHQAHVARLLSFLSLSPHIEPALLRSLCELLPYEAGNSGVEADVFLHPDVHWGYTSITLLGERREYYQQQFKQLDDALKKQVFALIERHHSEQFPSVWAETILNAEQLMKVDLAYPELLKKAEELMLRITLRYHHDPAHEGMMRFARRHIRRLKEEQRSAKKYVSALYPQAYRAELAAGQALPDWCDSEIANQVLRNLGERRQFYLYQQGTQLLITVQPQYRGQCLAEFSSLQDMVLVNGRKVALPAERPVSLTPQPPLPEGEGGRVPVAVSSSPSGRGVGVRAINLNTGQEHFVIASLRKPTWASELTMRDGQLVATLPFAGQDYLLEPVWQDEQLQWRTINEQQGVGYDEYGLYVDLTVKGITQRLRYIEPNTFMMGSPEGENGRYPDEDFHQVTLIQGYWLADTACTQALWQAVMGTNPAEFKGDLQYPVENVSWLDVQQFIQQLNEQSPGLVAHLPTEAQWENACRAGTDTPFSFGENMTPAQVNYDGNYPYADGQKGEFRQKTVPVKSLPVNQWGLYEMHGNVWEWCFDEWQKNLGDKPAFDPVTARFQSGVKPDKNGHLTATETTGSTQENFNWYDSKLLENGEDGAVDRVLRGGSWSDLGRLCRSAFRLRSSAGSRGRRYGFRFAVGHELKHSTVQYSEQTEQNTARRGAAQGFDQAGSVQDSVSSKKINAYIEAQKILSSTRSDDGFSVDDMDEPLIDRLAKGVKSLFGRKGKNGDDR